MGLLVKGWGIYKCVYLVIRQAYWMLSEFLPRRISVWIETYMISHYVSACASHCFSCSVNGAGKCDPDGCVKTLGIVFDTKSKNCECTYLPLELTNDVNILYI